MTNNNVPPSHQADSNQGLSVTGDAHIPQIRPNLNVDTDQPAVIDVPESAEIEGSESNPILLDSTPEDVAPLVPQPRQSRPRRNVGPPKFFGDRRFIDLVLEKDDRTSRSVTVHDDTLNHTRATITITSPSDLITPLAEAPPISTLVAETTLPWSSQKTCPSKKANYIPTQSISTNIDTDLKVRLDDFDARFN